MNVFKFRLDDYNLCRQQFWKGLQIHLDLEEFTVCKIESLLRWRSNTHSTTYRFLKKHRKTFLCDMNVVRLRLMFVWCVFVDYKNIWFLLIFHSCRLILHLFWLNVNFNPIHQKWTVDIKKYKLDSKNVIKFLNQKVYLGYHLISRTFSEYFK